MVLFLFAGVSLVFAHPPKDMQLSYDKEKGILHIEMSHVTNNVLKHNIRQIEVIKNAEEPILLHYVKQTTPQKQIEDVEIKAVVGDVISVDAVCSVAGSEKQSITIEEEKPKEEVK